MSKLLGHLAAYVVFRSVGVQWYLRPIEHHQQLGLVGVQPLEQTIQRGEACAAQEDTVEAGAQLAAPARRRIEPIRLQIGAINKASISERARPDGLESGDMQPANRTRPRRGKP